MSLFTVEAYISEVNLIKHFILEGSCRLPDSWHADCRLFEAGNTSSSRRFDFDKKWRQFWGRPTSGAFVLFGTTSHEDEDQGGKAFRQPQLRGSVSTANIIWSTGKVMGTWGRKCECGRGPWYLHLMHWQSCASKLISENANPGASG